MSSSSEDYDSPVDLELDDSVTSSDDENESEELVRHDQWVKSVEFSSYRSTSVDSVPRNTGVEKLCQANDLDFGDKSRAEVGWILANTNREESLIVSFERSVFINEIVIYESINPGSLVKLESMAGQRKKFLTMWQRASPVAAASPSTTHQIFKPLLRRYRLPSNSIRLTLDPRYTDRVGIQAIKLRGSNVFDVTIDRISLSHAMSKLYREATHQIHTDVQFRLSEKIIHAHRNVLCCRSDYFRALLCSDFMEKTQKQPIELTDVDAETFREILHFTYTGTYSRTLNYEFAITCMIYANKINFLTAKNAAIEQLCCHLRLNHQCILSIYCLIKPKSPAFDLLLDYVYDLCSDCLNDVCKQKEFAELPKDEMIDLIRQSTERREKRELERRQVISQPPPDDDDSDEDEDDE